MLENIARKAKIAFIKCCDYVCSFYTILELLIVDVGVSKSKAQKSDIKSPLLIITLTSYHKRFSTLLYTLKSLDNQKTKQTYEVHVHISLVDLKLKPQYKQRFKAIEGKSKVIKFFYYEENIYSYKKYYYTLTDNPDSVIITVDDDVIYPRYWLKKIISAHRKNPNCIVCYRGHYLQVDSEKNFKSYREIMSNQIACLEPSLKLLPTGVSGVLYPPGSLDLSIALDKSAFMNLAPKSDDFWLKLSSLSNDTPCIRVECYNKHFPHVPFSQLDSLANYNVSQASKGNDEVLKNLFLHYPLEMNRLITQ